MTLCVHVSIGHVCVRVWSANFSLSKRPSLLLLDSLLTRGGDLLVSGSGSGTPTIQGEPSLNKNEKIWDNVPIRVAPPPLRHWGHF